MSSNHITSRKTRPYNGAQWLASRSEDASQNPHSENDFQQYLINISSRIVFLSLG